MRAAAARSPPRLGGNKRSTSHHFDGARASFI
jgi:hypothetical protein